MEIRKIITEAIFIFFQHKVVFLKNFLPALVALFAIGLGMYSLDVGTKLSQEPPEFIYIPFLFLCVLAFLIILAKSIVHTHRTFILHEKAPIKDLFKITKRDLRFVKKFIALNFVMLLIGIVIMALFGRYLIDLAQDFENQAILIAIGLVTTSMTAFVWARLAIVLPSAALDHSISIQSAWQISDDYSWKLFVGVGLLPVITDLVISYLPSYESHFYTACIAVIWGVVAIIEIGVLSLIYKEITEKHVIAE